MNQEANQPSRNLIATGAVVAVLVALVGAVAAYSKRGSTASGGSDATASSGPTATAAADASLEGESTADVTSQYKDGTYTATGSYTSPGGSQKVTVTLTLASDAVSAASVREGASDPESEEYQRRFISGFASLVVGKPLADLSLGRVSGSSLTSIGFNAALDAIRNQAIN